MRHLTEAWGQAARPAEPPTEELLTTERTPGLEDSEGSAASETEVSESVDCLHRMGKYVCIETNGTHPLPDNIDWVTCSPKQGAKLCISRMDEVKVVYEGQDIAVYESLPAGHFFLQPCSCSNTAETVACVMQHPKWRLSLQTHKLIEIK